MTDTPDPEESAGEAEAEATPRRRPPRFDPRRAMLYTLGAFVVVLAFAVVLAFFAASDAEDTASDSTDVQELNLGADPGTFTATTLPPAGLLTMAGEVTDLPSVVAGKPTMLNMFSSSCTACRTEMPALERLHNAADGSLQVVGVNLGDSPENTETFVKQTGVTYPIVRDPNLLLVTALNVTAQPMTLWVDAEGAIVGHRYGELSEADMRVATEDYLGIQVPKA